MIVNTNIGFKGTNAAILRKRKILRYKYYKKNAETYIYIDHLICYQGLLKSKIHL